MTTYRSLFIRGIVLRNLSEIRGPQDFRYAQVVGILTALLRDDEEMVAAIEKACHEPREEEEAG